MEHEESSRFFSAPERSRKIERERHNNTGVRRIKEIDSRGTLSELCSRRDGEGGKEGIRGLPKREKSQTEKARPGRSGNVFEKKLYLG